MNDETYEALLNSIVARLKGLEGACMIFMLKILSKLERKIITDDIKKYKKRVRNRFRKLKHKNYEKNRTCRVCGGEACEMHHIIQIKNGGNNDERNLLSVCVECHKKIHE